MQKLSLTKKYTPHSKYKNSGVEWLGKIPYGWDTLRSKRLFAERKTKALLTDEQLTASQEHGVILQKEYMAKKGHSVVQVISGADILKHVEPNDFVISMRSFQGGIEWSKIRGSVSSAYVPLIPSELIYPPYFAYLLKSKSYIQALQLTSNLVRDGQALRFQNFTQVDLPVVSLDEQKKIAKFLDEQTTRIDETIAKKQKLIELLKEKRTATINHAVTKGLSPKVELVDSGIDWLGKINASFAIIKLRYLVKVSTGSKDTANADADGGYPFFVRSPNIERINSYSFDGEAVLTAGDGAGVGKVFHYYNGKFDYHQRVYLFSNFRKVTGKYFYYYLSSNLARIVLMGESKSTVDSIRMPQLLKMPFTVPSKEDQDRIVSYLDLETNKYDEVLEKVKYSVIKLQELKSSLISHAVTGKIKV